MAELELETQVQGPADLLTDYIAGYENARQTAPEMASNYVANTLVGDPLAEAMTEDLAEPRGRRVNAANPGGYGARRWRGAAEPSGVSAGIFQGRGNPAGMA